VNRYYVAIAALKTLADEGRIERRMVREAIDRYGLDPQKPDPTTV
jgi:pyruvate dehydrogenase E1 component